MPTLRGSPAALRVVSDPASSPSTCTRRAPSPPTSRRRQADDAPCPRHRARRRGGVRRHPRRGLARAGSGRDELAGEHAHRDRARARGERGARGHDRPGRDPRRDADAGPGRDRHAGADRRRRRPAPPRPSRPRPPPRPPRPRAPPRRATRPSRPPARRRASRASRRPRSPTPRTRSSRSRSARPRLQVETARSSRPIVTISTKSSDRGAEADDLDRRPRPDQPELLARDRRAGSDRRAELLHRQVPDPSVPPVDLPGRRHAVRRALGGPGRDQRDRDRLRPQPQRLLRGRPGLDAVHAVHLEDVRRRRQPRRQQGPLQPRGRDLRGRALPARRRAPTRTCAARSSPTTTPIGTSTPCCCAPASSAACRATSWAR